MELKLTDTRKFNSNEIKITTRDFYEVGDYNVIVDTYEHGFKKVSANPKSDVEYLPSIYDLHDFNDDGILYGFEISTTSYGKTMMVDDIRKMIKAYEQAIEVVEILTEKFVGNKIHR